MNRREKLIDNYEDALFAVLMDKVAEEEGAKLREENQRLQNNPEGVVPEHVDAVARQTIRKAFAGQNRRSAVHVARRVVNAVAMIVLICSALFVTACAAFPEVRVKTLNLLIQSSDVASRLMLMNENEVSNSVTKDVDTIIMCGYSLPVLDGFSVLEQHEDKHGGWIKFKNDERDASIRISIIKTGSEYVDTEDADSIEEIHIHDQSGMLIQKSNRVTIAWIEPEHETHITLVCNNLYREFIVQTAEQISFVGTQ